MRHQAELEDTVERRTAELRKAQEQAEEAKLEIVTSEAPSADLTAGKIQAWMEPATGFDAAIGGARMAPDVTVEECFRLARAMTMKNAVACISAAG